MKRILLVLSLLLICSSAYADVSNQLNITEEDGSPSTFPYKLKVTNGTLTDNLDGTVSVTTGGGAGSSPAAPIRGIQYNTASTFSADPVFVWFEGSNTLNISRDSGQVGEAIRVSSETGTILANISHDGTALFQGLSVVGASSFVRLNNGGALQTNQSAGDIVLLQAYDVDGTAYTTFGTLTANNTPTFDLSDTVTKSGGNYIYRAGGTDVPIADGGTGQSTATNAFDALAPTTTKGDVIVYNGSDNIRVAAGTNGNILSSDSSTASGLAWVSRDSVLPVKSKGSLMSFSTQPTELVVGANGTILSADSSTATGLRWATPPAGGAGTPSNPLNGIQYNIAGSFSADSTFTFFPSSNTINISRDASQVGEAIRISSDTGSILGNISHDGTAFFQSEQVNSFIQFPDLGYIKDGNGVSIMSFDTVTSPVNHFVVSSASTGINPVISADGADANLGIGLNTKGTGGVVITTGTVAQSIINAGLKVNAGSGSTSASSFAVVSADGTFAISSDSATGGLSTSGKFISSNTGSIGWKIKSGANTACDTTCTNAAVIAFDTTAGVYSLKDTNDATADICVCAGNS